MYLSLFFKKINIFQLIISLLLSTAWNHSCYNKGTWYWDGVIKNRSWPSIWNSKIFCWQQQTKIQSSPSCSNVTTHKGNNIQHRSRKYCINTVAQVQFFRVWPVTLKNWEQQYLTGNILKIIYLLWVMFKFKFMIIILNTNTYFIISDVIGVLTTIQPLEKSYINNRMTSRKTIMIQNIR